MKNIPFKRILGYVKPHIGSLILSLLGSVVYALSTLAVPVLVGKAIDIMAYGDVDMNAIIKYAAIIGGVTAVGTFARFLQGVANNRLAFMTVRDIRNDIISKLQKLTLSCFDSKKPGEIVNNMIGDAEIISDGFLMGITQLFTGVVTIVGTLVMMLVYNPLIAIVVVALTPLSVFSAKFIAKSSHKKFATQAALRGKLTAFVEEAVANNMMIRAFGQETNFEEKFDELNENLRKATKDATFFSSLPNPVTRFVNSVVYAAVALVGGLSAAGVYSLGTPITAGLLVGMLNYAGQYAKPFNEISGVITELQASVVSANRVFALLDAEEESADKGEAKEIQGEVELKNVAFSYDKTRPFITDVSLKVEKSSHVALVGTTGCGKTTLINLLMRFYDADGGEILVDGTDIKEMPRSTLRDAYGMVLQESWIRRGTVKENLTLGADIPIEKIEEAAKLCKADGFISRLEKGYDTVISENSLSQGERQLICITRVLLSEPKMLILDEATSAVDVRTERMINNAFDMLMQGKTSFIVAHRLSTIKNADKILVMHDGKIIEQGKHEELLEKGGFYSDLYYSGQV